MENPPQVSKCTNDHNHELQRLGIRIRQSWQCFSGPGSHPRALQKECATPPHVHPTSMYVTTRDEFYQAFPRVSTASDKCWDEKAWEQGYNERGESLEDLITCTMTTFYQCVCHPYVWSSLTLQSYSTYSMRTNCLQQYKQQLQTYTMKSYSTKVGNYTYLNDQNYY